MCLTRIGHPCVHQGYEATSDNACRCSLPAPSPPQRDRTCPSHPLPLAECSGAGPALQPLPPTGEEESCPWPGTSDDMAPNIIGLGLLVAGVSFLIVAGVVLWILGVICVHRRVAALWMPWQRKRRAAP